MLLLCAPHKASTSIDSADDLVSVVLDNALAILDALDDVFNIFSLTFLQITLGHPEEQWDASYGDNNWVHTGRGVSAGAGLKLANSAWARVGFFGGGFGVDMDNHAYAGGNLMGSNFEMFRVELALKLDVTVRNPIAEDIAEGISDALTNMGLKDALDGLSKGSVSREGIDDVVMLRSAACRLRERLATWLTDLTSQLGTMEAYEENRFGIALPALVGSMDQLMVGILEILGRGDTVKYATGGRSGLGALRDLLSTFATGGSSFFTGSGTSSTLSGVASAADDVRSGNEAMVSTLRTVPLRLQVVQEAIDQLVEILEDGDAVQRLTALSEWGVTMRALECSLRKTPDLTNRVAAIEIQVGSGLIGSLSRLGAQFVADADAVPPPLDAAHEPTCGHVSEQPVYGPSVARLAHEHFPGFADLCDRVQHVLARLTHLTGGARLATTLNDFKKAIGARRFRLAATILKRSNMCTSADNAVEHEQFCDEAVAVLSSGCEVAPQWAEPPAWRTAHAEFTLNGLHAEDSVLKIGSHDWVTVTLELGVALTVSGRARCSSAVVASTSFQLVQQNVNMTFYTDAPVDGVAELVLATTNALHVRANGQVVVNGTAVDRWWVDYTPLFVDMSALGAVQLRASTACAQADATAPLPNTNNASGAANAIGTHWTIPINVEEDDLMGRPWPLVVAIRSPPSRSRFMSDRSSNPYPLMVAPGVACQARCEIGLALQSIGTGPTSAALSHGLASVPSDIGTCLRYLRHDYAMCSVSKTAADKRFARCVGASGHDIQALYAWLRARPGSDNAPMVNIAMADLDCESFTSAKAMHCTCARSVDAQTVTMHNLDYGVGIMYDPQATNRPKDLVAVRERLLALGYGRASFSSTTPADSCDANLPSSTVLTPTASEPTPAPAFIGIQLQERLTRVLLCAAAGIITFEDACDLVRVNGNCAVGGIECPPLARTTRQSCLRISEPCASGLIEPRSDQHDALRSTDSPGWSTLPVRGDGFELHPSSDLFAFGTTWLVEALIAAGRHLKTSSPATPPLMVLAASRREGGLLPDRTTHQTGLELQLQLPQDHLQNIDWAAAREQVRALEAGGFVEGFVKVRGVGETSTCDWKPALCTATPGVPNAPSGTMVAKLPPRTLAERRKLNLLPSITLATLTVAVDDGKIVRLDVFGTHLGFSEHDVLEVAVGDHVCALESASPSAIVATCTASGRGKWLSGLASVTTASAGLGIASDPVVAVFVEATLPVQPPSPEYLSFSTSATQWSQLTLPSLLVNAPLVKPFDARLSSTFCAEVDSVCYHAANAIDGNASTASVSTDESRAWLSVRIPSGTHVGAAVVQYTSSNAIVSELGAFEVWVGSLPGDTSSSAVRCSSEAIADGGAGVHVIECSGASGEYVTLRQLGEARQLTIVELTILELVTPQLVQPYEEPVPLNGDSVQAVQRPVGLIELKRAQSAIHGRLPICPVAAPPQCNPPILALLESARPLPSLVTLPHPSISRTFTLNPPRLVTSRVQAIANDECAANTARDRYESCSARLLATHFPISADQHVDGTLFRYPFTSIVDGSSHGGLGNATATQTSCHGDDTFSFRGSVHVPLPGPLKMVPFEATLPLSSGTNGVCPTCAYCCDMMCIHTTRP